MNQVPLMLAVMGTTGSGKTSLAESLASELDAQLINADAFQVYRRLDIGTAKPIDKPRYEMLDLVEPTEEFGLGSYLKLVQPVLENCFNQGRNVIFVGGTGLYIRALFEGYDALYEAPDPEIRQRYMDLENEQGNDFLLRMLKERSPGAYEKVDRNNPLRVRRELEKLDSEPLQIPSLPKFSKLKVAISLEPEELRERVQKRLGIMIEQGWEAEAKSLFEDGVPIDAPGMRAIGYRNWYSHFEGNATLEETLSGIYFQTVQYAKRQRTWLRSEPKMHSFSGDDLKGIKKLVADWVTGG